MCRKTRDGRGKNRVVGNAECPRKKKPLRTGTFLGPGKKTRRTVRITKTWGIAPHEGWGPSNTLQYGRTWFGEIFKVDSLREWSLWDDQTKKRPPQIKWSCTRVLRKQKGGFGGALGLLINIHGNFKHGDVRNEVNHRKLMFTLIKTRWTLKGKW